MEIDHIYICTEKNAPAGDLLVEKNQYKTPKVRDPLLILAWEVFVTDIQKTTEP